MLFLSLSLARSACTRRLKFMAFRLFPTLTIEIRARTLQLALVLRHLTLRVVILRRLSEKLSGCQCETNSPCMYKANRAADA
jgi:hypothetical protein